MEITRLSARCQDLERECECERLVGDVNAREEDAEGMLDSLQLLRALADKDREVLRRTSKLQAMAGRLEAGDTARREATRQLEAGDALRREAIHRLKAHGGQEQGHVYLFHVAFIV